MKRLKSGSFPLDQLNPWDKAEKLLPEYSRVQFKDLEAFLADGGQMPPIVIAEDMRIIDGYNRWRMASQLGHSTIECDLYDYENEKEMEKHAIVLNSKRRHLSSIQVARAAARLSEILTEEEEVTQIVESVPEPEPEPEPVELTTPELEIGEQAPAETTPEPEEEPVPAPEVEVAETLVAPMPDHMVKAVKQASKKLRISRQTVERVKQVDDTNDRHLIEAMENKKVSLKQAAELAELPQPERHEVLAEIEKEKNTVDSSNAKVVLNACNVCSSRLKNSFKKLNLKELLPEKKEEIRSSITAIIQEAHNLLTILDQPIINDKTEPEAEQSPAEPETDQPADGNVAATEQPVTTEAE